MSDNSKEIQIKITDMEKRILKLFQEELLQPPIILTIMADLLGSIISSTICSCVVQSEQEDTLNELIKLTKDAFHTSAKDFYDLMKKGKQNE